MQQSHGLKLLLLAAFLCTFVQCGDEEAPGHARRRSLLKKESEVGNPFGKPLRADLVIAMPSTHSRSALVSASQASRKGIRTIVVVDKGPDLVTHAKKMQLKIKSRKEVIGSYKGGKDSAKLPADRLKEIRVALTPFLANQTLGTRSFKWILAGHDDTVFLVESVLNLLKDLNHNEPYLLTDNIWFTDDAGDASHPNKEAPTCVPCHRSYREYKMRTDENGNVSCLIDKQPVNVRCQCTVKGSGAKTVDSWESLGKTQGFRIHTGGGIIMSAGLFRRGTFDAVHAWMTAHADLSADALLTGAVWEVLGIGPSNPGYSICKLGANVFDPGWQEPRRRAAEDGGLDGGNDPAGVIQRFQWGLANDERCDTRCVKHMNSVVSVHVRSRFAKEDMPDGGAWDNSAPRFNATTTLIRTLTNVAETYLFQRWSEEKAYESFIV